MKASFDGARKRLGDQFNRLVHTNIDHEQKGILDDMRTTVIALLCMYDPNERNDCNDLSSTVRLDTPKNSEDSSPRR